jgi:orotidine-5'-phosphate decarboxylase
MAAYYQGRFGRSKLRSQLVFHKKGRLVDEIDGLDSRIIVSLDFPTAASAADLVTQLGPAATIYKVGLQLLTAAGPSVVRELVDAGKRVFLDLKLLEIPSSVAAAVSAAGNIGASMVTVHASGGSAVLRSAASRPQAGS